MNLSVPISKCLFTENEIQSVIEPLRSGWVVQGPKVLEFEESWSAFVGVEHSIAVSSGTAALHLALAAAGIGPGDEVIVPAFTWVSTANVVENLGARVVFCDVNLEDFNLSIAHLKTLVTSKTRAVIPVHLFGAAAQMEEVIEFAQASELSVVEDAACGFGTRVSEQHVGGLGDIGCFSFHPRKAITTGEGGMMTTSDLKLARKLRELRNHGMSQDAPEPHLVGQPYFMADHNVAGYNYRLTDIQAALGVAQMSRAEDIVSERRRLAQRYIHHLQGLPGLVVPGTQPNTTHAFQSFVCRLSDSSLDLDGLTSRRNRLMSALKEVGIMSRPGTHAVHTLAYYAQKYSLNPADLPGALVAHQTSFALPLFVGMTDDEQDYVVAQLTRLVQSPA